MGRGKIDLSAFKTNLKYGAQLDYIHKINKHVSTFVNGRLENKDYQIAGGARIEW